MQAYEAPIGMQLVTWAKIAKQSPALVVMFYRAQRLPRYGLLEVYERGGCGWRCRLTLKAPWEVVAERYEAAIAADLFLGHPWRLKEVTREEERPSHITFGMFGSPATEIARDLPRHLDDLSATEAYAQFGSSVPPRESFGRNPYDPEIAARKAQNRQVYDETLTCCQQGYYIAPSGRRVALPSSAELTARARVLTHSTPLPREVPHTEKTRFEVVGDDCVAAAKRLLDEGYRPAMLNMANRRTPGGGVIDGARAQEESLFRRSTLPLALYPFEAFHARYIGLPLREQAYPLNPQEGLIYTPGILFFRAPGADGDLPFLETPFALDVVTMPAINRPTLVSFAEMCPAHADATKVKIRAMLRVCAQQGNDALVLGAFGCGAFRNPAGHMAKLFHAVFHEAEFLDRFRRVTFAIRDDHNAYRAHNPYGNFFPFRAVFQK